MQLLLQHADPSRLVVTSFIDSALAAVKRAKLSIETGLLLGRKPAQVGWRAALAEITHRPGRGWLRHGSAGHRRPAHARMPGIMTV